MKILCFIDSLGSGGAQRQLTALGVGLKRRGHEVRFLVYHPHEHFRPCIDAAGIPCTLLECSSHIRRSVSIRRALRVGWQDVVIAFLEAPALYAELASLPRRKWKLIVGERSADPRISKRASRLIRCFHVFADVVVTNSFANCALLEEHLPFLKRRIVTIYNAVDLARFNLRDDTAAGVQSGRLRVVVVASYQENKNMLGLARALRLLLEADGSVIRRIIVDWYGDATQLHVAAYNDAVQYVKISGLSSVLRFHGPTRCVEKEFTQSSAVGLFSFFEGLPNVVCEGMACGRPIIMSDVCDARHLVEDGRNGFLCDPGSPSSIAAALKRFLSLSEAERLEFGAESRRRAEKLFDSQVMVERYEEVFRRARTRQQLPREVR